MNHIKEMADLEQRIEDAFKGDLDKANHKSRQELAAARDAKQKQLRTEHGLQCPECYGVRVSARQTRFDASPTGFQCNECGCQWSPRIEFKSVGAVRKR